MSYTIQFRRGTAANWTSTNPILAQGEFAIEIDTQLYKIGDGLNNWNSLAYGGLVATANIDGGNSNSNYTSTTTIDGGGA